MDIETGEALQDKETGEFPAVALINQETGEIEVNRVDPNKIRNGKKFRINRNVNKPLKYSKNKMNTSKRIPRPVTDNFTSALVYLLPSFILFVPLIAALLIIVEVMLHIWAHKKNNSLKNKNVYYQSPLHIFLREFCACCRQERSADKIASIQDRRNYKFIKYGIDYVQGIVM